MLDFNLVKIFTLLLYSFLSLIYTLLTL